MKPSKNVFYGLDIQSDYITVVQYAASTNSVTLIALQPVNEAGTGLAGASRELATLKSKFKFLDPHVNCSLPAEYAVVKRFPVDSSEKSPESALAWELEQNIVGSIDEYAFDIQRCSKQSGSVDEHLVVAYRKERINELTTVLKNNKLAARIVDLDIFALVNLFEASYPEAVAQPAIIIHAETRGAKLILTHHGKMLDYEPVYYEADPDADTFSELATRAAQRLCLAASLVGGSDGIPSFAAGLLFSQEGFLDKFKSGYAGVSLLNPFNKIECRIGVDEAKLATYLSQLAVAVGLAIRGDE